MSSYTPASVTEETLQAVSQSPMEQDTAVGLTRVDWRDLRLVWFVVAGALGLLLAYPPAAGLWFAGWVLWAMSRGGRLVPSLLLAGVPLTHNVMPTGVNLSIVEVGLVLAGLAAIGSAPRRLGPLLMPVAAYLAICLLSTAIEFRGRSAVISWIQTAVYLVLAVSVFARFVRDSRQVLIAVIALMGVSLCLSLFAMGQGGYVFGIHKNSLGATTAAATVCAMAVWLHVRQHSKPKMWTWVLALLSLALFMSLSRGAWAATVVGAIALAVVYRQWRVVFALAAIGIPVAVLGFFLLPEQHQAYVLSSVDIDSHSFGTRQHNADIAWGYFMNNPLLGSGMGIRKENDATNIVLFTLAETGFLGLAAFLWIHFSAGRALLRSYHFALPGSLTLMTAGLAMALIFGRFTHGLVDHYWSRGAITAAWCMVGGALALTQNANIETEDPHNEGNPT
ncbi:MAG: O-antigen ligase family protein [Rhodospirillales bacterium]|nr:O-antigen ligase family protein [Rhodospirillales bacterium]